MTAQLQLAVDVLTMDDALDAVDKVYPHFDIVEVGTPLVIECGLAPVEQIKSRWPDRQILADLKIMDAGNIEATSGFDRGADIVTILGLADDATVQGAVKAAEKFGGRIMADLINTPDPAGRAGQLAELGVHIMCLHTAYDRQSSGIDPLAELNNVRPAVTCPLAIAGGLKLDRVGEAVRRGADIVVVGGGILNENDPASTAEQIMTTIRSTERG